MMMMMVGGRRGVHFDSLVPSRLQYITSTPPHTHTHFLRAARHHYINATAPLISSTGVSVDILIERSEILWFSFFKNNHTSFSLKAAWRVGDATYLQTVYLKAGQPSIIHEKTL